MQYIAIDSGIIAEQQYDDMDHISLDLQWINVKEYKFTNTI